MFTDLKAAILAVLENPDTENLYILQQEYNIYFVEPEEKQCNLIIKS